MLVFLFLILLCLLCFSFLSVPLHSLLLFVHVLFIIQLVGEASPRHGIHKESWKSFIDAQVNGGKEWAVNQLSGFQHIVDIMSPAQALVDKLGEENEEEEGEHEEGASRNGQNEEQGTGQRQGEVD